MNNIQRCAGLLLIGLAACQPGPTPEQQRAAAAQAQAAAAQARAAKELDVYRQMIAAGKLEHAHALGKRLMSEYPNTPLAAEISKTFADVEAQATATADARRLPQLWSYQAGTEQGGKQTTASIYSSQPGGKEQIRLLLRKHSDWGQSAYLFDSGAGFDCKAPCKLSIRFDAGATSDWAGTIPETGEPAVFIDDDEKFIAKLKTVRTITIDAVRNGKGPVTILFEVGGYDSSLWP